MRPTASFVFVLPEWVCLSAAHAAVLETQLLECVCIGSHFHMAQSVCFLSAGLLWDCHAVPIWCSERTSHESICSSLPCLCSLANGTRKLPWPFRMCDWNVCVVSIVMEHYGAHSCKCCVFLPFGNVFAGRKIFGRGTKCFATRSTHTPADMSPSLGPPNWVGGFVHFGFVNSIGFVLVFGPPSCVCACRLWALMCTQTGCEFQGSLYGVVLHIYRPLRITTSAAPACGFSLSSRCFASGNCKTTVPICVLSWHALIPRQTCNPPSWGGRFC